MYIENIYRKYFIIFKLGINKVRDKDVDMLINLGALHVSYCQAIRG